MSNNWDLRKDFQRDLKDKKEVSRWESGESYCLQRNSMCKCPEIGSTMLSLGTVRCFV